MKSRIATPIDVLGSILRQLAGQTDSADVQVWAAKLLERGEAANLGAGGPSPAAASVAPSSVVGHVHGQ